MEVGDLVRIRRPGPLVSPIGIVVSRVGTSRFVNVRWTDPNACFRRKIPESFLEVVNESR